MPRRKQQLSQNNTGPKLPKIEVIENMVNGLYQVQPELFIPHTTGEILEPYQNEIIRGLLLGEEHRVSVAGGHGIGKCNDINSLAYLSNGLVVTFGELIDKGFSVLSVDKDLNVCETEARAESNGVRPVWKVTTESGRHMAATANHPLWHRPINDAPHWSPIGQLNIRDEICLFDKEKYYSQNKKDEGVFRWEKITAIEYQGERPTVAVYVPKTHTYLTDFVQHNTFLSSRISYLFLLNYRPSIIVATGPTGKQTRAQYWSHVISTIEKSVFAEDIECLKTRVFVKGPDAEEWKIIWVTSKDPKTIEGFHGPKEGENLLWIIEEGKGVADPVYEALSGALSHKNNFLYISSTCGPPRGYFFDSQTRLRNLFRAFRIPSTESSRVSPDQIKIWADQWGEDSPVFRARVMAEFPEEDDSAIASLSWLTRAIENPGDDFEQISA